MSDLDSIKNIIRAAMKSQGTYTEDLELTISDCAGSFIAYRIALGDIVKLKKSYLIEKSREGNKKYVMHPAFPALFKSSANLRQSLGSLGLTLQTLSASDKDEVNDLIDAVNKAGGDGE